MQNYEFNYNAYISKIKPKQKIGFTLILITIILLMGLCMFIGFSPNITQNFYFVEINSFYKYLDATNLASQLQNKGGAGYVYYDEKYHVLASFYPTKKEAESVCENLKEQYPNCAVFMVEAKKFKTNSKFSDQENKILANCNKANINLINEAYNHILSYDTSTHSIKKLKLNLTNSYDKYKNSTQDINTIFNNSNYSTSKQYVLDITDSVKSLTSDIEQSELNYTLKYNLIKIVLLHCAFLNSL